ncbi:F-box protein At5g51370-like isoform X2 [Phoenix dactylifera]|uniref:F-box protein At5g51370-like isoform X2 n=1 Tax=Phoenix dactylifera TaxID=42345 RepID=A0A8B8ZY91_PHODC|nr:F-box protein At5g51370-like isoform X2 [Phoenix dactylifera]
MHQQSPQRRLSSWPDFWFGDKPLKHVVLKMQLGDQILTLEPFPAGIPASMPPPPAGGPDLTALLSDELLLRILAALPDPLHSPASLVCKRWLRLLGRLRRSLTLLDWPFLYHRLPLRFPDLTDVDLVPASFASPSSCTATGGGVLTRGLVSVRMDPHAEPPIGGCRFLPTDVIDRGLEALARGCAGLRKLALVSAASESSLLTVAGECATLQELELHRCTDLALGPISAFKNLQILRLVGSVEGLYGGPGVTDIGLTILANGCKRLVKLELSGCEGSYDGISAVGRCCLMLEELTICDHRMDGGWMAALSFCENLKTLRLQSCKKIDTDPGPEEHLGSCPTIERLQLQRCQLRDKRSLHALFMVCESVREIMFQDCWGLDDEMFRITSIGRGIRLLGAGSLVLFRVGVTENIMWVKFLSLEGCSLLTTEGLELVILSWKDLQRLVVISCNKVKDDEVTPALASLFSVLKELKWRPDSKSVLDMNLAGTGMGKKGARFFRKFLQGRQHLKGKAEENP